MHVVANSYKPDQSESAVLHQVWHGLTPQQIAARRCEDTEQIEHATAQLMEKYDVGSLTGLAVVAQIALPRAVLTRAQ